MNLLDIPAHNTGSPVQLASSHYQVTLVDERDESIPPEKRARINRWFDREDERNLYVNALESAIHQRGGKIVHQPRRSHPCFAVFKIFNKGGVGDYSLVVYV